MLYVICCSLTALSPLIGHINSVFSGVETVRAFRREDTIRKEFCLFINNYNGCLFTEYSLTNWFCVRTNITSAALVCFCILTSASLSTCKGKKLPSLSLLQPFSFLLL